MCATILTALPLLSWMMQFTHRRKEGDANHKSELSIAKAQPRGGMSTSNILNRLVHSLTNYRTEQRIKLITGCVPGVPHLSGEDGEPWVLCAHGHLRLHLPTSPLTPAATSTNGEAMCECEREREEVWCVDEGEIRSVDGGRWRVSVGVWGDQSIELDHLSPIFRSSLAWGGACVGARYRWRKDVCVCCGRYVGLSRP